MFGALSAALVNYVSKQDNEVGDVARGVGKVALDVFNFLTKLNNKYDLTDKAGTAAIDAISQYVRNAAETTTLTASPRGELSVRPAWDSCQKAWLTLSRGPSSMVLFCGAPSGVSGPRP